MTKSILEGPVEFGEMLRVSSSSARYKLMYVDPVIRCLLLCTTFRTEP